MIHGNLKEMGIENHFITNFTEALSDLYLPKLSEEYLCRIIFFHLINASAFCGVAIHSVNIRNTQSQQYTVLINEELSIRFDLKEITKTHIKSV